MLIPWLIKHRETHGTCWSLPFIDCFPNHETVASQPPLNQQENIKTVRFQACLKSRYTKQSLGSRLPQQTPNQPQRTTPNASTKEFQRSCPLQGRASKQLSENAGCFVGVLERLWAFQGFSLGISGELWGGKTPHLRFKSNTRNHSSLRSNPRGRFFASLFVTICQDWSPVARQSLL